VIKFIALIKYSNILKDDNKSQRKINKIFIIINTALNNKSNIKEGNKNCELRTNTVNDT